jgi:sporulation protein YlmC with PRC-barrel domain
VRLQPLRDQPLLHTRWGRLVGWLRDVALDPPAGRATALEVELAVPPQRRWVAPFPLWRSRRLGAALETDPERWRPIERAYDWIGLDALDGLLVVDADGDWSARVADAEADPETWAITAYLLRRPWWHCLGRPRLVPDRVVSSGPDILVIERRQARSPASPPPSG